MILNVWIHFGWQTNQIQSEVIPDHKSILGSNHQAEEKFMLDSAFKGVWSWKTPTIVTSHNTRMHGTMNTEVDGKNTINATIVSTRDDHQSVFTVEYSDHVKQAMPTHNSIIYRYMDESCDEVPNFEDVPQICVDELLAVEYACGYAELQPTSGSNAAWICLTCYKGLTHCFLCVFLSRKWEFSLRILGYVSLLQKSMGVHSGLSQDWCHRGLFENRVRYVKIWWSIIIFLFQQPQKRGIRYTPYFKTRPEQLWMRRVTNKHS